MKIALLIPVMLLLASCGARELTVEGFARFNARRLLLEETWRDKPDSLALYLAGLYKQERLTPEQVAGFMKKVDQKPELWIKAQELTLRELEGLKPKP